MYQLFFEPFTPKRPLRPIFRVKEPLYRPPTQFIRISKSRAIPWCQEKKICRTRFLAMAFDELKGQIVKFFQRISNPQAKLGGSSSMVFGLGAIPRPVGVPPANLFESQLQGPEREGVPERFRGWYTTRKSYLKKGLEHWKKLVTFVGSKRP